jgi:hypothetical protein
MLVVADGALAAKTIERAAAPDPRPYLRRPAVLAPIFLAFPLITLPLAVLTLTGPSTASRVFGGVFLWTLGLTHFLITFAV